MNTSVNTLIAATVAIAATFCTAASAQSLAERHEQHKAQINNFLHGRGGSAPAPHYADSARGHRGWHGDRGYGQHGNRGPIPQNRQYAQYENGQFKGYITEGEYAKPNGR